MLIAAIFKNMLKARTSSVRKNPSEGRIDGNFSLNPGRLAHRQVREMWRVVSHVCPGSGIIGHVYDGLSLHWIFESHFHLPFSLANRSGKLCGSNSAMRLPDRHDAK